MSLIKKHVEEFKVPAYHNEELTEVSSEDLKGHWSLLFFYPGDFTFVCPTELEDLQNLYSEFKDLNCEIYAISTDSEFVHKAWHDKSEKIKKIEYPMLSDRAFALSKQFGVLKEADGQSQRGAFLINPDLDVVLYEVSADGIGRNAHELLRKLQAAQYVDKYGDQVCPANWTPGEDTLKPGIDLVGNL
ncbi:MAG: redoxin domain-containing protein [Finegoldia sp.]|uniref:redoxin domain-containing protein n=1 Tax=Finegoldia sp. TaxID=1981334 RepID=UPI0025CEFF3A|nr:redoxin domain-containing protein [uncultured Finegoldia sp.]MDU1832410.1 redoxin domain-containing protein [Finegoldia magna]